MNLCKCGRGITFPEEFPTEQRALIINLVILSLLKFNILFVSAVPCLFYIQIS